MKLVEILARELEKWPKNVYSFGCDSDGEIRAYDQEGGADERHNRHDFFPKTPVDCSDKASGYGSTCSPVLVTREMWQAERKRIAKPGKKANAEGWVRHRGGKCPVYGNEVVVVKFRDGSVKPPARACAWAWHHTKDDDDIMRYKLHKPAEQPAPEIKVTHIDHEAGAIRAESVPSSCGPITLDWQEVQPITAATKREHPVIDGPLQWRDRIREIDRTVEALEEERVSLIQRLEGEGFKLIDQVNAKIAEAARAHEDMSDWRNWKVGDRLIVSGNCGSFPDSFSDKYGVVLRIRESGDGLEIANSKKSDYGWYFTSSECETDLAFHSRPSA